MFVLLSRSQQLLDILGDLLGFADDILRAGKCWVGLRLQIIQLRDRAALPEPTTAPQPPSPPQTAEGDAKKNHVYCQYHCLLFLSHRQNSTLIHFKPSSWVMFLPRILHLRLIECVVIVTFWHAALLL